MLAVVMVDNCSSPDLPSGMLSISIMCIARLKSLYRSV